MNTSKAKHRVLIMTPDRDFATQFLDICREHGELITVNACVSVPATMMLSSHYGPRMLLADIRYGEHVLRQMFRELKYENPHLVVILVGEQQREMRRVAQRVKANGWISQNHADCCRLVNLLASRPVEQEYRPTPPLLPWTMPPLQPKQVYS